MRLRDDFYDIQVTCQLTEGNAAFTIRSTSDHPVALTLISENLTLLGAPRGIPAGGMATFSGEIPNKNAPCLLIVIPDGNEKGKKEIYFR